MIPAQSRLISKQFKSAFRENPIRCLVLRHRERAYFLQTQIVKSVPQRALHQFRGKSPALIRRMDEVAHLGSPSRIVRIDIEPAPSNHPLVCVEQDRPGCETIWAQTLRVVAKPLVTYLSRLRTEGKSHVFAVALDLVERIDVGVLEFAKNQVPGSKFRHAHSLSQPASRHRDGCHDQHQTRKTICEGDKPRANRKLSNLGGKNSVQA